MIRKIMKVKMGALERISEWLLSKKLSKVRTSITQTIIKKKSWLRTMFERMQKRTKAQSAKCKAQSANRLSVKCFKHSDTA